MRISTDGFIDIRAHVKVRTPGIHDFKVEPMPEAEAMAFLLSHSFPGYRRIVRPLSPRERRALKRASWADLVNERMSIVDRVWRDITAPVSPPSDPEEPELVQIVRMDGEWDVFPVHPQMIECGIMHRRRQAMGNRPSYEPDEASGSGNHRSSPSEWSCSRKPG